MHKRDILFYRLLLSLFQQKWDYFISISGVDEDFAIVNEYRSDIAGELIYHFDFYRIKKLEEVYDMGYEDYLYSGCLLYTSLPRTKAEWHPQPLLARQPCAATGGLPAPRSRKRQTQVTYLSLIHI